TSAGSPAPAADTGRETAWRVPGGSGRRPTPGVPASWPARPDEGRGRPWVPGEPSGRSGSAGRPRRGRESGATSRGRWKAEPQGVGQWRPRAHLVGGIAQSADAADREAERAWHTSTG